jgi:hypothetical protein
MGQDLLQIVNQGFNPLQIISQKTGKSMAQLKDDMSAGLITFSMVEDAFKTATLQGGKFYNGMENGSKTLSGTMSTLSDNIKITARNIVGLSDAGDVVKGGLFDKVSQAIQVMITYLDAHKEQIAAWGQEMINQGINWVTQVAIPWIQVHWPAIKQAIKTTYDNVFTFFDYILKNKEVVIGAVVAIGAAWAFANPMAAALALIVSAGAGLGWLIDKKDVLVGAGVAAGVAWAWVNPWAAAIGAAAIGVGKIVDYFKEANSYKSNPEAQKKIDAATPTINGTLKTPWSKSNGLIGFNANGTDSWSGGPTWVGERGPEIVVPPRGSKIIPNNQIAGGGVTINIGTVYARNEQEVNDLFNLLGRKLELARMGLQS